MRPRRPCPPGSGCARSTCGSRTDRGCPGVEWRRRTGPCRVPRRRQTPEIAPTGLSQTGAASWMPWYLSEKMPTRRPGRGRCRTSPRKKSRADRTLKPPARLRSSLRLACKRGSECSHPSREPPRLHGRVRLTRLSCARKPCSTQRSTGNAQRRSAMNTAPSTLPRALLTLLATAALAAFLDPLARAAEAATSQVLEYHADAQRSGRYVVPALTWEAAGHLQRDAKFQAEIAGPVYAQPLYWHPPGSTRALLLVASEQNTVFALDSQSGAVVWKSSLGTPVPHPSLPCGNIDPLGITGTPVIDESSQALFVGAMIADKTSGAPKHFIFALSLKDGSVLPGWPIDVEAALRASGKSFRSSVQNQRGALTLAGNTVYVPYGGHWGDCGDYRGWVVGVSLDPAHTVHNWSTRARGGGAWATGGVSSGGKGLSGAPR